MESPRVLRILLVEDNPSDVLLFREALVSAGTAADLVVAANGREALDLLSGPGPYAGGARPDLVLLDINLPILDGRAVLAEMAADPDLNTIPVVIMTGSRYESGVARLYPEDRCLFAVKPVVFRDLVALVRRVEQFAASFRGHGEQRGRGDGSVHP